MRDWTVGAELSRDWLIDQYPIFAPSRRVLTKRTHTSHQHSGGQIGSSLLGELRRRTSAAGCSFRELLSSFGCLMMNCPSPLEGYFSLRNQYRSSEVRSRSLQATLEEIFQSLSLLCSFLNIPYQLPYLSKPLPLCDLMLQFPRLLLVLH